MLKAYEYILHCYVNGKEVGHTNSHDVVQLEEEHNNQKEILLDKSNWSDTFEFLKNNSLYGFLEPRRTLFRNIRLIRVEYDWEHFKDFKQTENFECDLYYEIKESDVSLNWIIKNINADKCIQYIKERGLTVCPIK